MNQSTPPSPSQSIPSLTSITGPPLLAAVLNWGLFGILSTQVFIYYQAFQRDKVLLKALVYTVYVLEAAQAILFVDNAWQAYAAGFGNINAVTSIGTSAISVGLIGGLVAFMVQSFYAYRIFMLSENKIITGVIIFMTLSSYAGSLATSISLMQTKRFGAFLFDKKLFSESATFGLWQIGGTVCDVLIASCMTYYLKKMSQSGGLLPTQRIIGRVFRLTVETGTVTATVSIVSVAIYYAITQLQYYEVPLATIAKLYSNTMLVALNSRIKFKVVTDSTTWNEAAVVSLHFQSSDDTETAQPRPEFTESANGPVAFVVSGTRDHASIENHRRKTQEIVEVFT